MNSFKLYSEAFISISTKKTIQTKGLKLIREKVVLRDDLNYYISRQEVYFLTACLLFDPDIHVAISMALRPSVGLIGLNNSSLDSLIKYSKIFKLHAALHDAASFAKDCKDRVPGFVYAFHYFTLRNCLFDYLTELLFTLFVKVFHPQLFCDLEF